MGDEFHKWFKKPYQPNPLNMNQPNLDQLKKNLEDAQKALTDAQASLNKAKTDSGPQEYVVVETSSINRNSSGLVNIKIEWKKTSADSASLRLNGKEVSFTFIVPGGYKPYHKGDASTGPIYKTCLEAQHDEERHLGLRV